MADISITPANVISHGTRIDRTAGATVAAGDLVYDDVAAGNSKLADNDSATAAARSPKGFALNGAANGQPLKVHTKGPLTVGAVLAPGIAYYLSGTPGKICPVGDLSTGDYPVFVGMATSSSVLDVAIKESGVAL